MMQGTCLIAVYWFVLLELQHVVQTSTGGLNWFQSMADHNDCAELQKLSTLGMEV